MTPWYEGMRKLRKWGQGSWVGGSIATPNREAMHCIVPRPPLPSSPTLLPALPFLDTLLSFS